MNTAVPTVGENALCRGMKRPALRATGPVRHMVCGEGFAESVEFVEPLWFVICRQCKREGRAPKLAQACLNKRQKVAAVPHFAVLPCCLQAGRVSKTAGGKSGIRDLPKQPLVN